MQRILVFCLLGSLPPMLTIQAAPAPKRVAAKPAVIDAGTEQHISGLQEQIIRYARFAVRENKKVANLDLVRRQQDQEAWLTKNLHVERVKDSKLVRVSFQDGRPEEQAAIINVVVDFYLQVDIDQRRQSEKRHLQRLKDHLTKGRRSGKITPEQAAKAEQKIKELEEYVRTLPKLVEPAKAS